MVFRKSLILLMALLSAGIAKADFSGDYVITNWTINTQSFGCGSSNINTTNTPASVTYTVAAGCANQFALLEYASLPRTGSLTFSYSITGGDANHVGSYSINGVATNFVTANGGTRSGTVTVAPVTAGQQFRITLAKNGGGAGSSMTISNFTYSESVPTLSEWALLLFGLLMVGAIVWHQRPGLRNARQ